MKLNSIIYCFILWAFVEAVVIAIALFRLHKMRKLRQISRQYHTRKSFFLKKGISGDELLQELFLVLHLISQSKGFCSKQSK